MIFGRPDKFAVALDVVEIFDGYVFGTFNFIVDDVFYPAVGSNYTLNVIADFFKSSIGEIDAAKIFNWHHVENNELAVLFSKQYGNFNYLISDYDEYFSMEQYGVDFTPEEIADKNIGLWFFKDEKHNTWLLFTANGGKVVKKIHIELSELIEIFSSVYLYVPRHP